MTATPLTRLCLLALPLAALGCSDPEGRYDEFVERADFAGAAPLPEGGCPTPEADEVDGQFLLALSTTVSPKKPVLLLLDVTAEQLSAGKVKVSIGGTALNAADRKTPVGDPIPPASFEVEGGLFKVDLEAFPVTGDANPILPGVQMVAEVSLEGRACSAKTTDDPDATFDFLCGNMDGNALEPAMIALAGSRFAASRVVSDETLTNPVINCDMENADPLP